MNASLPYYVAPAYGRLIDAAHEHPVPAVQGVWNLYWCSLQIGVWMSPGVMCWTVVDQRPSIQNAVYWVG